MHWERLKNNSPESKSGKPRAGVALATCSRLPAWHSVSLGWGPRLARLGLPFLRLTLETGEGQGTRWGTSDLFSIQAGLAGLGILC